jgi:hypothetical protein
LWSNPLKKQSIKTFLSLAYKKAAKGVVRLYKKIAENLRAAVYQYCCHKSCELMCSPYSPA